jgi:arylsulfatase I/J
MPSPRSLAALVAAAASAAARAAAAAPPTQPNILMVLVDDFGWGNLGLHNPGNPEVVTPNLDALAQSGILLDRHYVFKYCSPSRCALQSGRNPVHVNVLNDKIVLHNPADTVSGQQGIPRNMTTIAAKMKSAGYVTGAVGKWNAGIRFREQTPKGRGYDSGLTYFDYDTDFWDETRPLCNKSLTVDMWDTEGPGSRYNGSQSCTQDNQTCTYQDEIFVQRVAEVLKNHSAQTPSAPLFLFWAPHAPHDPYQVPDAYLNKPIFASINVTERRFYSAMVNLLDDNVGRVVQMFKDYGLWENTLMVLSSDNGGPEGSGYGANNYPLFGSKSSNWEGGVRVNAFAAGGLIPASRQGTVESGLIEIADWWATFCGLAGVAADDPAAARAGLPPPDGLDMWPLLSGANATSPRRYILLGSSDNAQDAGNTIITGIVRADGFKLLLGEISSAFWTGPVFPNATGAGGGSKNCGTKGCLYNVFTDPTEHNEVSAEHPDVVAELQAIITAESRTLFNPDRGTDDGKACEVAFKVHGGFIGPFD